MSFALIGTTNASGVSGGTSAAINTSGANILVASVAYNGVAAGNISDSYGNTWVPLTQYTSGFGPDRSEQLLYVVNPVVGAGHTFTTNSSLSTVVIGAWSGADTSSPFDVESGGNGSSTLTVPLPSFTPSVNGELLVSGCQDGSAAGIASVDQGLTISANVPLSPGTYYGCAMAWKEQSTAAAIVVTWTFSGANTSAASIAAFKPGVSAPNAFPKPPRTVIRPSISRGLF